MAGGAKPEFPPLLPVGFHDIGIAGIRRLCVGRFPQSVTRPRIMQNLDALVALVNQSGIVGELWVDGSFVTDKLNPDDVDLAFVISATAFRSMDIRQRQFFDWFRTISLKDQYKCDNYCFVDDEAAPEGEWLRAYWLRQFGFSRASEMKGLAVVKVPFVVIP